jgi:hypothetical protein
LFGYASVWTGTTGPFKKTYSEDGSLANASFSYSTGIVFDKLDGCLYVGGGTHIRKISDGMLVRL